mmetsp:Transcript_18714/g.24706  ORF Transcript_18714/g.24706 Transcript_18714/m.24706 type:complete len:416 (+) Transcript_18714:104-1351(+)
MVFQYFNRLLFLQKTSPRLGLLQQEQRFTPTFRFFDHEKTIKSNLTSLFNLPRWSLVPLAFAVSNIACCDSKLSDELEEDFQIFTGEGKPIELKQMIKNIISEDKKIVFIGEVHDDPIAHSLELTILKELHKHLDNKDQRIKSKDGMIPMKFALSLEMFESDVQQVVDEYLQGVIRLQDFLADSRPWNNYLKDYHPLVTYAKQHGFDVIAANAPRRYVGLVGTKGRGALKGLSQDYLSTVLPPLPYPEVSERYKTKFFNTMAPGLLDKPRQEENEKNFKEERLQQAEDGGGCPHIGFKQSQIAKALNGMALWDSSMAHFISNKLKENHLKGQSSFIVHICGKFHCEEKLGIPEMLAKHFFLSSSSPHNSGHIVVIVISPEESYKTFDKSLHQHVGDYVILTDAKKPRSFEIQHPI